MYDSVHQWREDIREWKCGEKVWWRQMPVRMGKERRINTTEARWEHGRSDCQAVDALQPGYSDSAALDTLIFEV
jgi:hypothetical protein